MTHQQDRTVATLERAIQTVLSRGLHDPRVRGMISVTRVEMAPDRREAIVGISVMPAEHEELCMHGIRHATKYIRGEVARLVRLRSIPELRFQSDASLKKGADVLAAIERGRQRDAELRSGRSPEETDSEE